MSPPPRSHKVGTSSPSRAGAVQLEESHCFNYSHIITPINCHVFVNAQEKKKGTKGNKKDGKAEIASVVITPGDKLAALISVLTEAPSAGQRPAISHSSTGGDWKVGTVKHAARGLSGAALAAARTQASAANPLYSPINPPTAAHILSGRWCERVSASRWSRSGGVDTEGHYRHNHILLISSGEVTVMM